MKETEFYDLNDAEVLLILQHLPDKIHEPYFKERIKVLYNNRLRDDNTTWNNISDSSFETINA
jgi:hypothetical protein